MTPVELQEYLDLTAAIAYFEGELGGAVRARHELVLRSAVEPERAAARGVVQAAAEAGEPALARLGDGTPVLEANDAGDLAAAEIQAAAERGRRDAAEARAAPRRIRPARRGR